MNYTKIGALPTHRYIWVDSAYTHDEIHSCEETQTPAPVH